MANKYLLDSSAWIEYFAGTEIGSRVKEIIEEKETQTCIISMAEISDKFNREKENLENFLAFIKNTSTIASLSFSACADSGKLKAERRKIKKEFSLIDAIIYLTAKENENTLVTKDNDFEGMNNVIVLK